MNGLRNLLRATFLTAAMIATGIEAQAMTFPQFDHMADQDRQDYLNFMVKSAQQVLENQGRHADAVKVHRLFTEYAHSGDGLPLGEAELETNLDAARVRDAGRIVQNPNAPRIQIETALIGTLDKNGITLTPDFVKGFVQVASTFQPQFPPLTTQTKDNNK